jgi:hypothetical protein
MPTTKLHAVRPSYNTNPSHIENENLPKRHGWYGACEFLYYFSLRADVNFPLAGFASHKRSHSEGSIDEVMFLDAYRDLSARSKQTPSPQGIAVQTSASSEEAQSFYQARSTSSLNRSDAATDEARFVEQNVGLAL